MLVLSRNLGERVEVIINGVVVATMTVTDIRQGRVWLGFDGPDETIFLRSELADRMNGHLERPSKRLV